MGIIVGVDVGGSTTKIVGFDGKKLLSPDFVKANDPVASLFGGFGKFTTDNKITLSDIDEVMVTGVGSAYIGSDIYGLPATHVDEFRADGRGGLWLSGLKEAIVVSMGTGTANVYANADTDEYIYLGGTGVGGGTLSGLASLLLGMSDVRHVSELAESGDLSKIDLCISDITERDLIPTLTNSATASNFGKLSDLASREDIALGLINMVFETVAMLAIFSARMKKIRDIVLIGNLSVLPQAKPIFDNLSKMFNMNFIIPENAGFGTVIGAALENKR